MCPCSVIGCVPIDAYAYTAHTLQNSIPKIPLRGEVHKVSATASVCARAMFDGQVRVHAGPSALNTLTSSTKSSFLDTASLDRSRKNCCTN